MIDIIAVTYNQNQILKCFINSIKAQVNPNWNLYIVHDGPNKELKQELTQNNYLGTNIKFIEYPERQNDYGHTLRGWALQKFVSNKYVLITNGDNYYTPIFVDEISKCEQDFIYFDMIHSHPTKNNHNQTSYGLLNSKLQRGWIDMGNVVIKSELAKKIGFTHRDYAADWHYFNDILKTSPSIKKIDKILMTHN